MMATWEGRGFSWINATTLFFIFSPIIIIIILHFTKENKGDDKKDGGKALS
jgi:hypothetical protein